MLSKKGKYALKALVYLSDLEPGLLGGVSDIAEARAIPRKFLETILVELRNGGFVVSRKGKAGGYKLARPAAEISIGSVIRTIDGPLAPIACASRSRYEPCEDCDESVCEVRHLMIEVRQSICDVLDTRSLADLRAQASLAGLIEVPCP